MTYALVEAARDRSAVRRGILATLAGAVVTGGLLVSQLGGVPGPEIDPPTVSGAVHRLVIPGDAYGQCRVAARVNGEVFRSLLDTGDSGHLTFGRNHSARLGFDSAKLSFSHSYGSANGVGHYARVRVREFRLETFVLRDVPADITDAPQSEPLLGIEILRRLNLKLKDGNCELSWS